MMLYLVWPLLFSKPLWVGQGPSGASSGQTTAPGRICIG